jgi:Lambda phage tail tape-measure protein (Tape_meas_lam_C)
MAAGNVQVVLSMNAANYTQALKNAQAQLDSFAGKTRGAGHATVSSMQASSAAIRTLEGGMANNVRAVERFITTIPGVGRALQAIFPVVGALATLGIFAKMGKEVYDFIQTTNKVPQAIQTGFRDLSNSSLLANDELRKTNDTLQAQIDKLSGHHQNTLALTLDEARINADKLAQSLDRDNQQIQQLLKTNQITTLGAMFTGKGGTADVSGSVNYYDQQLANAGHAYNLAVHNAGGDTNNPAVQAAQAAIDARRADAQRWTQSQITSRRAGIGYYGDQSANLNILTGYQDVLNGQQDQENLQSDNVKLAARAKSLQAAKDFADQQKQAQEKIVKDWRDQLDAQEAAQGKSNEREVEFWAAKAQSVKQGSLAYKAALDEANKVAREDRTSTTHGSADLLTNLGNDGRLGQGIAEPGSGQARIEAILAKQQTETLESNKAGISEDSKSAVDYLKNLNEGVNIQRQNATALAEQSLQSAVATGRMSQLDAAQITATMHAQDYADTLERLQAAIESVNSDPGLSNLDKLRQTSGLNNQVSSLNGARAVQLAQDNSAIDSQSLSGSIRDALNLYVQQATDTAAQIREVMTSAFESVNSSLSESLMAPSHNRTEYWRNVRNGLAGSARGIGSHLLNSGLNQAEGGVLSAFGFGSQTKPDGSAGNPLYVRMAGGIPGVGSASTSSIGSFVRGIFGGGLTSSASQVLSSAQSVATGLSTTATDTSSVLDSIPLQGFFAGGGDVAANRPAIIGERGPEMFVPNSAGRIIPNNQLGGNSHTAYIDARGATDQAGTEAAVHRAMRQYGPYLVQQSVQATNERSKRLPTSRR